MKKIKVLFYGSCWPTNMGNAFCNLGAIQTVKMALGDDGEVFHAGGISNYLFSNHKKFGNSLRFEDIIDCDYLVQAGMTMCPAHLKVGVPIFKTFQKRGVKIIFLGGGAGNYTDPEIVEVQEAMKKFPIYALISRDRYTFDNYAHLAENSYDGIDSAFFISDYYDKPVPYNISPFDVVNFDTLKEPKIKTQNERVIRTHHSCWEPFLRKEDFAKKDTLISDLPSDYLSLYAQTDVTYSDRVHACIATLSYGNKAMYYKKTDPRLHMFQRVGVGDILERPVALDQEFMKKEKQNQVDYLRSILL